MNAANEEVVNAFLQDKIAFIEMPALIEQCMEKISFIEKPALEDYISTDKETRLYAQRILFR